MDASSLKECLEDKVRFLELQAFFIEKAVAEASAQAKDLTFPQLLKAGLKALAHQNAEIVFASSESPIETVFLNSLALCFIRNALPLVLTPPMRDASEQLAEFRDELANLAEFTRWYSEHRKDESGLQEYLDNQVRSGRMEARERPHIERLILYYSWLPFGDAHHLTPQASFPEVTVDGASVRVDALLWIPAKPKWTLAVECDSFEFHLSREAFVKDRRKDRALKAAGLEVHRFSGREIVKDPAGSANELFGYLLKGRADA
jgi:hypothetical protein